MADLIDTITIMQDGKVWNLNDLPDGFVIKGDLDLSDKELEKLPDLSKVTVEGNFNCDNNFLTSLEGAPKEVGGSFDCSHNYLTSLEGIPEKVGGSFDCSHNQLTSLEGAPKEVGGSFGCSGNQLTRLEGAPEKVGGDFDCSGNQLTSLEGAPKEVEDYFLCDYNQLTSLEGAPEKVGGKFYCGMEIAEKYGLNDEFTLDDLKASELYIKETKQEMIDKKTQELKYKVLRIFAKENVSSEKGVVNPKRSNADKVVIKAVMKQISENIVK